MKKLIFFTLSIYSLLSFSQDLVSTIPSKKVALIEEFTAVRCGNCPNAHSIATIIENENPDQVISIRYHHGFLATPSGGSLDFRTDFSGPLAQQANLAGQPLATVNRHLFSGQTSTSQNSGQWEASSLEIIGEQAIVNIGAMAIIDSSTNELEIMVELYYTGTQTEPTNSLNIALIQNNIIAPQTLYGTAPQPNDFLETGLYSHNHVLRHLITGQWGFTIDPNDGPLLSRKFNYNIPGQFKNIPVDLTNLELVIFINEGNQEVLNAISVTPTFSPPETVSVQESENIITDLYPNPVSKNATINIETKAKNIDQLNIIDISGRVLYQDKTFNQKTSLQLNSLNYKPGIYFIQLIQDKQAISNEKLIIY